MNLLDTEPRPEAGADCLDLLARKLLGLGLPITAIDSGEVGFNPWLTTDGSTPRLSLGFLLPTEESRGFLARKQLPFPSGSLLIDVIGETIFYSWPGNGSSPAILTANGEGPHRFAWRAMKVIYEDLTGGDPGVDYAPEPERVLVNPAAFWGRAQSLVENLAERGLTVASAESSTGLKFGATLTALDANGQTYRGGTLLHNRAGKEWFGVRDAHDPYAPNVGTEMAKLAAEQFGADIGISLVGITTKWDIVHQRLSLGWTQASFYVDGLGYQREFTVSVTDRTEMKLMIVYETMGILQAIIKGDAAVAAMGD